MAAPTQTPPRKAPKPPAAPPPKPDLEQYAEVGDTVQWFPGADGNERPQPAFVSQVGHENTVTANVVTGLRDLIVEEGCRHVGDPKARVDNSGGGWRHRPLVVAVRRMLIEYELLEWRLDPAGQWRLEQPAPKPTQPQIGSPTDPLKSNALPPTS
jgi:hypothetical protein